MLKGRNIDILGKLLDWNGAKFQLGQVLIPAELAWYIQKLFSSGVYATLESLRVISGPEVGIV
jgi:hypothetical protein